MCTICSALHSFDNSCAYEDLAADNTVVETTDAPFDVTTPYEMTVGGTFQGNIDAVADRDWVAITLTAGQTYDIDVRGSLSGVGTLADTIMAIYDVNGTYLAGNDDGGAGTESYLSFTATTTGTYYVMARGYQTQTGSYEISVALDRPAPVTGDLDTLATYLTDDYWSDTGGGAHQFDTSASTVITVDITGLTAEGQQLARWAMQAWEAVADIDFSEVTSGAQISFDDDQAGAFASYSASGGNTISSNINVSTAWLASQGSTLGSYGFQTYLHEIGHALGLGHMGAYNGNATYGQDESFINDSWQMSVMSYFDQGENTTVTASQANLVTAMGADILAIQSLYGAADGSSLTGGKTTYGVGHNLGSSWLGQIFDTMPASIAMTIFDASGRDVIDFSDDTANQTVNLGPEGISDVYGLTGNLVIARDSWIEEFRAGSGDDTVIGSSRKNTLVGNDGDDSLNGGNGADILRGGAGADVLIGGNGRDRADYAEAGAGVTVDLLSPGDNTGEAAGDTFDSIENITGSNFADTLLGANGGNVLNGRKGKDDLDGRGGADTLIGGNGWDTLIGGKGDDSLTGGAGRDTFIYNKGADVITDFGDDRLKLDDKLWGNASLSKAQILEFADVVSGDTVFDFGNGNTLTLENYTDIAGLESLLGVI